MLGRTVCILIELLDYLLVRSLALICQSKRDYVITALAVNHEKNQWHKVKSQLDLLALDDTEQVFVLEVGLQHQESAKNEAGN